MLLRLRFRVLPEKVAFWQQLTALECQVVRR